MKDIFGNDMPAKYYPGYSNSISKSDFNYHSILPHVTKSLLIRAMDGDQVIEWVTAPVPEDFSGRCITFVWLFAIDVTDESKKFHLFIDDEQSLTFKNPKIEQLMDWKLIGKRGEELLFRGTFL